MLTLVYGRAGSGKSRYCVERALELARQGERSTIVVPEQSSFSCERALVSRGADAPLQFVQTRSFRKLCEDIFSERGGGAQVRVGEAQKCALVRRALESLGDDVKFYRRCRKDSAFFALVAQAADELKNAAVTPEDLAQAAQQAESAHSRDKLIELSLICERYGTLLLQTGCDAASELQSAAEMCRSALQFRDTTIFFDGYSGFTEPEFSLLFSLLARSSELVCTLCCDDPESTSDDALAGVRATGRRLLSEATSRGIPSRELSLGASHRFQAEGLRAAEGFFACGDKLISRDGVYLLKARDRYDEAERVAAEISMLVRERGFCYSEIAVITRDIELYRAPLERTFNRFGIPFFTDAEDNLLHAPTTAFLLCALSLARSLTTEKLLALLKTSLCGISAEQVAALENYAFVWSVEGAAWFSPFEKNPDGFGPLVTESQRTALANVEALRARVAIWLSPYLDSAKLSRGKALVSLIYELMENCGALETLAHEDSRAVRVACAGISLLEQLYDIACDDELTASELGDLARTLASSTPLSDIPPALEQVVIGGADRTRVDEPRALFALGLNDGVFPRTEFDAPLLTQRERELLGECGIRLGRDIERCEKMEELYLYRALSSASERLYLCLSRHGDTGELVPCASLSVFLENGDCLVPESESLLCPLAVNEQTALRAYAAARERRDIFQSSLLENTFSADIRDTISAAEAEPATALSNTELSRALLGDVAVFSPTRIETFGQCRFSYFLKYIMKIRPLKKAEFNPIEAGSFVHAVMEGALRELADNLATASDAELFAASDRAADSYISARVGRETLEADARLRYLVHRLMEQSRRLLMQLRLEQAQSEFRVADCELKISRAGDVAPLELRCANGAVVFVEGTVDRVDIYRKNGIAYIRVVDYKTGAKAFSLSDVFYGLNIQMLLYLMALCKNAQTRYGETAPAAVMYMPGDPSAPSADDSPEIAARKAYRMDGLVLDDPEIIKALERDAQGVFIPVELDKNGNPKKSDKLASLARLGRIFTHVESTVIDMADALYAGDIECCPILRNDKEQCLWCDYVALCRRDRSRKVRELKNLGSGLFEDIESEKEDDET